MTLYRYVPIWRRVPGGATLYRCFEIPGKGFTVQSRDFFWLKDIKDTKQSHHHEAQFLELLIDEAPEVRSEVHPTVEMAIERFDAGFED